MTARLEARGLTGGYPGVTVFSGASFSVDAGGVLAILGANGSGKSALLETLQGLLPRSGGVIVLEGEEIQDLPAETRAARGIGLVSDRRRLWTEMTVAEHLRLGAFRAAARSGWRARAARMSDLFEAIGERRGARPRELSAGEQQQLALARFGMSAAGVWLLDDPFHGLDEAATALVLGWIRRASEDGAAVVLTGQHVGPMLAIASTAMFLEDGSLVPIPTGAEGLRDPRVRRLL